MKGQEIKSMAKEKDKVEMEVEAMLESAQKKEKRHRALNAVGYAAGSIVLFAIASAALPSILSKVSGALYKSFLKKTNHDDDDDDWGPIIERKEKPAEQERQEQAELQMEVSTNGRN